MLPAGSLYVDVDVQSTEGGSDYNGIPVGEINALVDLIAYIDSVSNTSVTSGGGDVEDDEDLRERIRLSRQTDPRLVPKTHINIMPYQQMQL